ncbi:hybrid sensor histidine kinase/response regulator [Niastella yeongjuensis]|uniref:histidine kinase n=1 Tax=Niastella yeongjuensis TaxID=354355 RepID=A0A1V9ELC2_9BACT|nr:PAS domain S-box protein [Niastella yeongjuensis]OQP46947.1 hybrid sensor histidine kinase/response regulator [Niastella yeongjuensis]SEN61961.1 PAS domain S-box-containing protein [Niastella yeongjuensis]
MIVSNLQARILIVDDDEDDYLITSDLIRSIPSSGFTLNWCYSYKDALEQMKSRANDIYFIDYRLGAKTGLDLLKEAIASGCEEPVILLTGKGNHTVDMEAMRVGAMDYLVKGELNEEKLERSIRYALERSASVKALRANERKYRNMFERSKDMVFIANQQGCFNDVNNATTDLLGYTREELMEINIYDLFIQKREEERFRYLFNEREEVNDLEAEIRTKTGDHRICIISASLERGNVNQGYMQGIVHDITNLKKAEKATLQIEKLAAAGRLVRTLAHEVRNPLNNINLSVEHLREETANEDGSTYLEIIQRNSNRIGALITELLNSSRPAEMKMESHVLQSIMDESILDAIDRLTLQRIKLEIKYPDTPVLVTVDKEKLKLAFSNILINATEAINHKQGRISVVINYAPDPSIVISDNGCGISEENISRLFEPYFTSKRNGMGLGLASTLNIIQSNKGAIDVKSTLNVGTSFIITFPKNHDVVEL